MTREEFNQKCENMSYSKNGHSQRKIIDLEDVQILSRFLNETHEAELKAIIINAENIELEVKHEINELKNRKCEGCKEFNSIVACHGDCLELGHIVDSYFCCSRWEKK